MSEANLIVISGCSGGGKSTLLAEFVKQGYSVIPEVGRKIVNEQLAANGNITPWKNPKAFCETAIKESIAAYHEALSLINSAKDQLVIFDRCFLDNVSYYQTLDSDDRDKYNHLIHDLKYYHTVFMAPPWEEIFCQDDERQHSYNDAVKEYERLLVFYTQSGYKIIELPKISSILRYKFIISVLLEKKMASQNPTLPKSAQSVQEALIKKGLNLK
jgi:predicted ATPase